MLMLPKIVKRVDINEISVPYNVTGLVAMDKAFWNANKKNFQGTTSGWTDLRGYGALIHPNCKLTVSETKKKSRANILKTALHGNHHHSFYRSIRFDELV